MKFLYAGIFLLLAFILSTYFFETAKSEKKIAISVKKLLLMTLSAAFFQTLILLTTVPQLAELLYSGYFISILYALYHLLVTCIRYTGCESKLKKYKIVLFFAILTDTVLLLTNALGHLMFTVEYVNIDHSESYIYDYKETALFSYHSVLTYCFMGMILFVLIYTILHTVEIYRKKYILPAFSFLFIIIWTFYYQHFSVVVDMSVVGYSITSIFTYYLTLFYKPTLIVDKMFAHVAAGEYDSIMFFDIFGECVYINESGKKLFQIKGEPTERDLEWITEFLDRLEIDPEEERLIETKSVETEGFLKFYSVEYRKLLKKGSVIGSYYRIKDVTEIEMQLEEGRFLKNHDRLTGLLNEEAFSTRTEKTLKKYPEKDYCIFASDVKSFKLINDIFGKDIGDDVLIDISTVFRTICADNGICCRLNADKFCGLIEKKYLSEENIVKAQENVAFVRGQDFPIIMQVGIYNIDDKDLPISVMIDRAYLAIAEHKEDYHKKIYYYDDNIKQSRYWEQKLSGELDNAISEGQFKVHLQPQWDSTGNVLGAEALIRWEHPTEGSMAPGRFIEMFEKNGMISRLDKFVWESVAGLLSKWKREGKEHLYISVNISPIDFYFINIFEEFKSLVQNHKIDPSRLKLEITETSIIRDMDRKLKIIEELRGYGFIVEMDDFGSGYSSLNMLKEIMVDVLKLDMGFLYRAKDDKKSKKIIEMIINLSRELGMEIICEGVETEDQLKCLSNLGCNCFQGYYFSKPIPIEEFETKYM